MAMIYAGSIVRRAQRSLLRALGSLSLLCGSQCASNPSTYALTALPRVWSDENGAEQPAQPMLPIGMPAASSPTGSLSVETIQSGQNLVVVQLAELPPPERLGSGLTEFVVWIEDTHGQRVKAGTLRYDRARHSGNLLATTALSAFTVQVTGERSEDVSAPSDVLIAERRVAPR